MESADLSATGLRFLLASKRLADASAQLKTAIEEQMDAQAAYMAAYRAMPPDERAAVAEIGAAPE